METVTVQIKKAGKSWEETKAVKHTFDNWQEVSKFAYHLTIQFNCEVRVESKGKGHYYNVSNALNFLSVS